MFPATFPATYIQHNTQVGLPLSYLRAILDLHYNNVYYNQTMILSLPENPFFFFLQIAHQVIYATIFTCMQINNSQWH